MVLFRRSEKRLSNFLTRTDDPDGSTHDYSSSELSSGFSRQFGKDHGWLMGQKILFEFDPASTYEKVIKDFVLECKANGETVIVLTEKSGPISSAIRTQTNVKFVYMTAQVSAPKEISENEVLLPWGYGSLVFNTLHADLEGRRDENINTICCNLSSSILTFGLKRAYSFLKGELELVISPRITHMNLLNVTAHDPEEVSTIEGLFSNILTCDERGCGPLSWRKPNICSRNLQFRNVKNACTYEDFGFPAVEELKGKRRLKKAALT